MNGDKDQSLRGVKRRVLFCQIVLCAIIFIDFILVWYLLVAIPSDCARWAAKTAGRVTCELMPGAYVVAAFALIAAVACVFVIYRISQKGMGKD